MEDKKEKGKDHSRLGIDYDLDGIDPHYVARFAKIYRVVGLIVVFAFVIWGVSERGYSDAPFEVLAETFGAGRDRDLWSYVIAAASLATGYYCRFQVGAISATIIFKTFDLIKSVFKRI